MKVSIILAVYNEEQYISKCIQTLLSQTEAELEILIIDDGSKIPVSSLKITHLNNSTLHVFRTNHDGPAKARNYGVSQSNGNIVVFLDGDMYFEPDFIAQLIEPIIKGNAKGTFSSQEYVANWENVWARCWNWEQGLYGTLRIKAQDNMVRDFRAILKSEFVRVGGFDDTGYTDTWTLSKKLGYLPLETQARYYHFNPETLKEVIHQAKWIGGRIRKLGILGKFIAMLRSSIPLSLVVATVKAIRMRSLEMFIFKVVYDYGIFLGILHSAHKK